MKKNRPERKGTTVGIDSRSLVPARSPRQGGLSLDTVAIRKAYRRYAKLYDVYFGAVFQPGRKAVVDKLRCRPGDRILEVGVGTGLSLPLYPSCVRITGIDLSPEMLEKAKERALREGLTHVTDLKVMDAEQMSFPDGSFDKVVAMYVASVVPHPVRLVREMRRVCKKGGEIFIVNHFHSSNPVIAKVETLLAPLSRLLGFRPDFCLDTFVRDTGLKVTDCHRVNLFGYWSLLRTTNDEDTLPKRRQAQR